MLLSLLLSLQDVYAAPDREPSADETLILEYMNRFRADPSAEADLIAPPGRKDMGVDWKMFRDEMKALKPAPPLVFNLELLDSARKHSYYMIFNGLGHVEEAGKKGFTGVGFGDRAKAAGYRGFAGAENAYAQSGGAWSSHWGFVVDFGAGPGGMQPERGHRRNMISPGSKEVGPGGVPSGKGLSVTHNFGSRDGRFAGGVVYVDLNGNNFYDLGEGLGAVAILSSDGVVASTWKAGAYTLELKGQKELTLTAVLGTEKLTKAFPAGAENVKFDWAVPKEVPLKAADRLIDAVEKAADPKSPKHLQARVSLYVNTKASYLDAERKQRVAELTRDVGEPLEADQKAVLEALKDPDAKDLKKTIDEHRKAWKGTEADAWFQDAEVIGRLKRGLSNTQKQPKLSDRDKKLFIAALEQEGARLKTPHFKPELASLLAKAKGL